MENKQQNSPNNQNSNPETQSPGSEVSIPPEERKLTPPPMPSEPPLPVTQPVTPANSAPSPVNQSPVASPPKPKKKKVWLLLILALLLATAGVIAYFFLKPETVVAPEPEMALTPSVTPEPKTAPSLLPGVQIVNGSICRVSADQEVVTLVDKDKYQGEGITGFDQLSLSPDGTKMAFLGLTSAPPVWLYYATIDGNQPTKLGLSKEFVWSPDSQKIAFTDLVTDVSPVNLWFFDTITGKAQNLSQSLQNSQETGLIRSYSIPTWSADSTQLTSSFSEIGVDGITQQSGTTTFNLLTNETVDQLAEATI